MKILVVDDDPLVRSVFASILENLGHEAVYCESGNEALTLVDGLDLAIIDAHLEDMTGRELDCKLREKLGDNTCEIVVTSAHALERLQKKYPDWAVKYYLRKPFSEAGVKDILNLVAKGSV